MSSRHDPEEFLQEGNTSLRTRTSEDALPARQNSSSSNSRAISPCPELQRLVFPDPVAFKYFENDPIATVLKRRCKLQGYEVYIVEQWACSRTHPTYVVTTYTGCAAHFIWAGVIGVPKDESRWSPRLKLYLKAMREYHARERETPEGQLLVTSLGALPSSLTVIHVSDGDIRKYRENFIVNEDLKRLGCAGRAALNLQAPQSSTAAKFYHLFRIRNNLNLSASVMELVKLCQLSLVLYGKLAPVYADGLLCDITEKSVNEWWSDVGTYIYDIEPEEKAMDPTTVAALIGLVMGAFNRLKAVGAPVGKDVYDIASTKRAVSYFQKTQRMERSRRLDRQTLMRLHKVTAKTASGEGWNVPKAVKSTVAELSGKGGEMVMGMVGARDKAGIAEVETLYIDSLAQLVTGPRARWLWQGKAAHPAAIEHLESSPSSNQEKIFGTDDKGNYIWTALSDQTVPAEQRSNEEGQVDDQESRTGFGRFKDAVTLPGFRTHQSKHSKDWAKSSTITSSGFGEQPGPPVAGSPLMKQQPHVQLNKFSDSFRAGPKDSGTEVFSTAEATTSRSSISNQEFVQEQNAGCDAKQRRSGISTDLELPSQMVSHEVVRWEKSSPPNTGQQLSLDRRVHQFDAPMLRQSRSLSQLADVDNRCFHLARLPQCSSFSALENYFSKSNNAEEEPSTGSSHIKGPREDMADIEADAFQLSIKAQTIHGLEQITVPQTKEKVQEIDRHKTENQTRRQELEIVLEQRLTEHQRQKSRLKDVMGEERHRLNEALRKVEMLEAQLDYELDALQSKVEEAEDGVADYARSVRNIEGRLEELVEDEDTKGTLWWKSWLGVWRGNRSDAGNQNQFDRSSVK